MKVYNQIKKDLSIVMFIAVVIILIYDVFEFGWDTTDGDDRSGLSLHVDALSGCHYLAGPRGGLIPRVNGTGVHICSGI